MGIYGGNGVGKVKGTGYFPFERNNYFYGKLLTVRDFETEQTYFNNKRRLINRLLHGGGVVTGLQVVAVDDKTITVEPGVALDYFGREIVVTSPITMKLSMVEGFVSNEYSKNVYLCIAYDEKGKEPVHALGNQGGAANINEYNRVAEGYRLFIREDAPDLSSFPHLQLFRQQTLLYQDDNLSVWLQTPRYAGPNEVFTATIRLEKTLQTPKLRFECEWLLDGVLPVSEKEQKVFFQEDDNENNTVYEINTTFRADRQGDAKVAIKPDTGKLFVGDKLIQIEMEAANVVQVVAGHQAEQYLKDYYNRTLQQSLHSNASGFIHLAKIDLLQVGPSYVIEKVEQVPFGEYVYSTSVLAHLLPSAAVPQTNEQTFAVQSSAYWVGANEEPRLDVSYLSDNRLLDFRLGIPRYKQPSGQQRFKMGVTEITINSENVFIRKSFIGSEITAVTKELKHGLGPGHVYVHVGVDESWESEATYYGATDVFRQSPFEDDVMVGKIGVICYPKSGTFRVGLKLPQEFMDKKLRLRWWAIREDSEVAEDVMKATEEVASTEEGE